jgi:hypothetical protein
MSKTKSDYVARIKEIIQDDEEITYSYIDNNIDSAVQEYQKRRPNIDAEEYSGDGSTYNLELPTDWEDGFSWILAIQYPVEDEGKPQFLKTNKYQLIYTPTGRKIRIYSPFASGEIAWVIFVKKHTISDSDVTVPDSDFEAICAYASADCCSQIARYYAQTARATIGADVVDYWERATLYSEQSDRLMEKFERHIPKEFTGDVGSWDLSPLGTDEFIFPRDTEAKESGKTFVKDF